MISREKDFRIKSSSMPTGHRGIGGREPRQVREEAAVSVAACVMVHLVVHGRLGVCVDALRPLSELQSSLICLLCHNVPFRDS